MRCLAKIKSQGDRRTIGKIYRDAFRVEERGTLLSKPASGRAAANASATCDSTAVRRAVPQFASIDVASTVCGRSKVGFPFSFGSSVAAIVATCRLFRVDRRRAFAAFVRRFDPKYPFIPNGLRFDLSTAFRRGSVRFVAPTARPPNADFSSQASSFKALKR